MGALDQNAAVALLKAVLTQTSVASTTGINVRYGSTAPTGSSNMTELASGGGYATGGANCSWTTPTTSGGGGTSSNSTVLSNTNSSSGSWSIVGLELWDRAGTPLRWMYGEWTGEPVAVAIGNTFQVAAGALVATFQ
jgi:hypothetical protein